MYVCMYGWMDGWMFECSVHTSTPGSVGLRVMEKA